MDIPSGQEGAFLPVGDGIPGIGVASTVAATAAESITFSNAQAQTAGVRVRRASDRSRVLEQDQGGASRRSSILSTEGMNELGDQGEEGEAWFDAESSPGRTSGEGTDELSGGGDGVGVGLGLIFGEGARGGQVDLAARGGEVEIERGREVTPPRYGPVAGTTELGPPPSASVAVPTRGPVRLTFPFGDRTDLEKLAGPSGAVSAGPRSFFNNLLSRAAVARGTGMTSSGTSSHASSPRPSYARSSSERRASSSGAPAAPGGADGPHPESRTTPPSPQPLATEFDSPPSSPPATQTRGIPPTLESLGLSLHALTPSLPIGKTHALCGAILDSVLLIGTSNGLYFLPLPFPGGINERREEGKKQKKLERKPIVLIKRTRFRELAVLSERSNVLLAIAGRNSHIRGEYLRLPYWSVERD